MRFGNAVDLLVPVDSTRETLEKQVFYLIFSPYQNFACFEYVRDLQLPPRIWVR